MSLACMTAATLAAETLACSGREVSGIAEWLTTLSACAAALSLAISSATRVESRWYSAIIRCVSALAFAALMFWSSMGDSRKHPPATSSMARIRAADFISIASVFR
jgi:hypothetical protein